MNIKLVNLHRQQQFYHQKTARICRAQTLPKPYIRRKPNISQDEEMANCLEQAEKERKQFYVSFFEHYFGRSLTKEEKQKLMLYL